MKKIFILFALVSIAINLNGQSQVENLFRDAKEFNQAYLENDFDKFTSLMIPSIVELAGGHDIMVKVSKEQFKTMTSEGMEFVSIKPLKPGKIMLAGEDLHAILPQEVITKLGKDKYKRTAYYLASSNDDGDSWTFIDLDPYDSESIKTFVPSFTGDLEIPEIEYAEKIEKE